MISGVFYMGADLPVLLETNVNLPDTVSVLVRLPDGTEKEYTATVVDFSKASATIAAEDNTTFGEISMQVKAEFETVTLYGETESLVVLNSFAEPVVP